ncbi:MAG TPA: hypothetical protein VIR16_04420, partial [Candidatus Limnocylindrales bacterium]
MADQLNLGFDPALPRAGGVAPMWPVPRRDPFDSADHLFEPTWGGLRVLVFLQPSGGVRVVDSSSTDLAGRLPELGGLHGVVDARSAVIDGELVAVDGLGRADGAALRARLAGERVRTVSLLAFDLLHHNGTWILGKPLEARRALLRKVMADSDAGVVVPVIAGEGRALYDAVARQGIAGVLARSRTSPYLPGVRSRLWRSIAVPVADGPDADRGAGTAAGEPDVAEADPGHRAAP